MKKKAKKNFEDNHSHNVLRFFDVKQSVITSNKLGIYELPYELPRLRILGN